MKEGKSGKSKLGVIVATIIGILGLGTITGLLTKGMRTVKVVTTSNAYKKTIKTSKSAIKNNSNLPSSKVIDHAKDGKSAFDTGRTVHGNNEREKESEKRSSKYQQ